MATSSVSEPVADESPSAPVHRPGLGKFLWYCYGGSLPPRYSTWVLHDVTCRTWALRHFARSAMFAIPAFALFMLVLPTPFGIRLFTSIAVGGGIFMFALVNILIDTDRRAVRAGYSYNLPGEIRGSRSVDHQRLANHERRERRAARQDRRRR